MLTWRRNQYDYGSEISPFCLHLSAKLLVLSLKRKNGMFVEPVKVEIEDEQEN
jgi:hypothetical protein